MKYSTKVLLGLGILVLIIGIILFNNGSLTNDNVREKTIVKDSISSIKRSTDFSQITRGARVFKQNCASCHGQQAEGEKNWRKLNEDDQYPAPPLNGTGHAWHHSNEVNAITIRNGTKHLGGNMPAWKDKLSDSDIMDVIAWFQSKWPDEVYQVWSEKFEEQKQHN